MYENKNITQLLYGFSEILARYLRVRVYFEQPAPELRDKWYGSIVVIGSDARTLRATLRYLTARLSPDIIVVSGMREEYGLTKFYVDFVSPCAANINSDKGVICV